MRNISDTRILIVEDDNNVQTTLQMMIVEMGGSVANITLAPNGAAALAILKTSERPFDLVISDWNMPQKSGIDLLKDLRTTHPDLPFLMITARADKDSIIDAKNSDVTGYVRKPVTFDEIKKKIFTILHQEE